MTVTIKLTNKQALQLYHVIDDKLELEGYIQEDDVKDHLPDIRDSLESTLVEEGELP